MAKGGNIALDLRYQAGYKKIVVSENALLLTRAFSISSCNDILLLDTATIDCQPGSIHKTPSHHHGGGGRGEKTFVHPLLRLSDPNNMGRTMEILEDAQV